VIRLGAVLLVFALCSAAQTSIENAGKPMRVPFECTQADMVATGLSCSEDEPCPVYLELANMQAVGNKIFLIGNLHTPTTTLYSILLVSDDSGATWTEPNPRIRSTGLDQIQFFDFQNGWISGANLQGAPRDPFFLVTTDGGKTWRQRPVFDQSRLASIERFRFDSPENGSLLVDARLDNNRREFYETRTGGENWELKQSSVDPIPFPGKAAPPDSGWRLRTDAATRSYVVEKSEGNHWQRIASFLVESGVCKL
jgi:hypothetical protein